MADIDGAIAPAEAAIGKPRPAAWWLGSFAVAGGLVVSALVHLALVGTVLFVTPKLLPAAHWSNVQVTVAVAGVVPPQVSPGLDGPQAVTEKFAFVSVSMSIFASFTSSGDTVAGARSNAVGFVISLSRCSVVIKQ